MNILLTKAECREVFQDSSLATIFYKKPFHFKTLKIAYDPAW